MELEAKKLIQAQFDATVEGKKGDYDIRGTVSILNGKVSGIYNGSLKKGNKVIMTFNRQGSLSMSLYDYTDYADVVGAVMEFAESANSLTSSSVEGMEVSEDSEV